MDKFYFWFGIIAAVCIAIYMMPQLVKVIKTKDTVSISIIMVILAVVGDLCFVINGAGIIGDGKGVTTGLPILLANLFGLIISGLILFFKIRNIRWAKKFNIKESQIPNHYKEIKKALAKARAQKQAQKYAEEQKQQVDKVKKETPVKTGDELI